MAHHTPHRPQATDDRPAQSQHAEANATRKLLTMPRGACVIRYPGKKAVVWRIKYIDAGGRHIIETLGREPHWNRSRAERELGKRLATVDEAGYVKPERLTFAAYSQRFFNDYLAGRNLKPSTLENYQYLLDKHLLPHFGQHQVTDLELRPQLIDSYLALKIRQGLSAKTVHNHLMLLSSMLRRAVIWRLIRSNPVDLIDRPRLNQPEMNILTPVEINRLLASYDQLIDQADEDEQPWWLLAKQITQLALGTGIRRGELLGLRWQNVDLLQGRITICEAIVRGKPTSPKSRASNRILELGPHTQQALEQRWQTSHHQADTDLVFSHPNLGTALDPSKLARQYLKPALNHAGIHKTIRPFHDLRHTSLTHTAAAGNPPIYVQHRAGHSQASITERYLHAAQTHFPGAAQRSEEQMFGPGRRTTGE
jgi:integrase